LLGLVVSRGVPEHSPDLQFSGRDLFRRTLAQFSFILRSWIVAGQPSGMLGCVAF
jgi:hypothetical protein